MPQPKLTHDRLAVVVERFGPLCVVFPLSPPLFCSSPTFVLFIPLKIDPKGVISPTFRTTGLSQSFFSCLQANEVISFLDIQ